MSTSRENLPAVEDVKAATFEADAKGLWGRIFTPAARMFLAALLVGGAGATGTYALAQSTVKEIAAKAADAGIVPLAAKVDRMEDRVGRMEKQLDLLQATAERKEERDAQRFDALYRTMLSGRAQPDAPMLAQPAVDGGR